MSFPLAELKKYIREECLRDDRGRPLPSHRRLRVLALYIEGTMEGMPPIKHWECPVEGGWNEDGSDGGEAFDVDGTVGRIQVICDREVTSRRKEIVFRLCAIMGTEVSISPTTITHSYPFKVRPIRRILAQDSDEASPFAESVVEANQRGFDTLGFTALRAANEILFPQLQAAAERAETTIADLRAQLVEERAENADLRTRLRASEDNQLERALKVREHAFKQRLKERGAKMVISTATMVVSAYLAKQKGDDGGRRQMGPGGGGGGGGGGGFRALPPENGASPASEASGQAGDQAGGQGPQAGHKHCATCTCTPEQIAAQPAQQPQQTPEQSQEDRDDEVLRRAAKNDFNLDALFDIFVREIRSYATELAQAFSVESQALLFQAYQEYTDTGRVGPILLAGICDNFETNEQVHAVMSKIRSDKGKAAFASILKEHWLKREREKQEGQEFVEDIDARSDRLSSGEVANVVPSIPDNPEVDIEIAQPKLLTRKEAAEQRTQALARGEKTSQKVDVPRGKREKPL